MRRSASVCLLLGVGVLLAGVQSRAQTPTTAAPLFVPDPAATPPFADTGLILDYAVDATCGGEAVQASRAEAAAPLLTPAFTSESGDPRLTQSIRLAFSIAGDGRVYSVRKVVDTPIAPTPIIISSSDQSGLEATLIGWRFAPIARTGCELLARPVATPLKDADTSLKARAMALGVNRASWGAALIRAMERPGDNCRRRPGFRTSVAGDPGVKPPPGALAWGAYRFDVDAEGKIQNIETLDASPDPDVQASWRQALGTSDFYPGQARVGCVVAFTRTGDTPPPGPVPMPDWRDLNHCTPWQRARFTPGALVYPESLQKRGVEGWALVRYDLASWGRVGGIEVLQSEPVAAFGERARQIVQNGRVTPALEHATQCVDRVVFRMSDEDRETTDAD